MAREELQLHLTKDDLTNAEDLLAFHEAQKHDMNKGKVLIRKDVFGFNRDTFSALLRDYRAMRKLLRELEVDVEWKLPAKHRVRFESSDDKDVPDFIKKPWNKRIAERERPEEPKRAPKKRVKLDDKKRRVRL